MDFNWKENRKPNRDKQIAVRVTEDEKRKMERFAFESGYASVSDWARDVMFADMSSDVRPKKETRGR